MAEYLPLADQLNLLFETVKKPDQSTYTLKDVSEATGVSLPTLSQLRTGKSTNPQLSTLRALCQFFNVPLRYFDTTSVEECLAIIAEGRHKDDPDHTNFIGIMASTLSPQGQRDLLTIIRWARLAEQQAANAPDEAPMPRLGDDDQ
ncbi:MAG: hypothetical protein OHK0046_52280 [Anaerolineae bacterium]